MSKNLSEFTYRFLVILFRHMEKAHFSDIRNISSIQKLLFFSCILNDDDL